MVKKPCWARTLPAPPQVPQAEGLVPARAPAPPQGSQVTVPGTRIVACRPRERLFEGDLHVVAKVRAAGRLATAAAARGATHELAEQVVEHIGKARSEIEIARARARAAARSNAAWPNRS